MIDKTGECGEIALNYMRQLPSRGCIQSKYCMLNMRCAKVSNSVDHALLIDTCVPSNNSQCKRMRIYMRQIISRLVCPSSKYVGMYSEHR